MNLHHSNSTNNNHLQLQPFHRTSDEHDSRSATIEAVRRPRGRPPGSKNKPKPPILNLTNIDPLNLMSPYILEVASGNDVVHAISRFCLRKSISLCVLTASGAVSNVTLRQPSTSPVTFQGRFDILSISATVLPSSTSCPVVPNAFTISLAGPRGQIVGGAVAGPLLAAGTVYLIAATFNSPSYHLLPAEEELRNSDNSGSGDGLSPPVSGGGAQQQACDVIWGPTSRQPPQPRYQ